MSSFLSKIYLLWDKSPLCVGLDTDIHRLPKHLTPSIDNIFEFNKEIIDATQDLVCCYKPQIAYYAACGAEMALQRTIEYIHTAYPQVPVILDSKRGDIGDTAQLYAKEAFERFQADAVTVNPYMGGDTLRPFLDYKDKGVIVLCKTSNLGSSELQDLLVDGKPLYQVVAQKAVKDWNYNNNILLVVGGTHPQELQRVRELVGDDIVFLVPGLGSQGGEARTIITHGGNSKGKGLIINSSRGIIYASSGKDFAAAARSAALKAVEQMKCP